MDRRLLLATTNPGKLAELAALLADLPGLQLLSPADVGLSGLQVVEDGDSYAANAALKAAAFARAGGLAALADNSGLEVDALGGAPGLHSARFAPGPGAGDAERRARLLERLAGHPGPWTARFRSTVCLALPGAGSAEPELHFAEGECRGAISPVERGAGGFGYDPVFLVEGTGETMAELEMARKNQLSHRARAIENIKPSLARRLATG